MENESFDETLARFRIILKNIASEVKELKSKRTLF